MVEWHLRLFAVLFSKQFCQFREVSGVEPTNVLRVCADLHCINQFTQPMRGRFSLRTILYAVCYALTRWRCGIGLETVNARGRCSPTISIERDWICIFSTNCRRDSGVLWPFQGPMKRQKLPFQTKHDICIIWETYGSLSDFNSVDEGQSATRICWTHL